MREVQIKLRELVRQYELDEDYDESMLIGACAEASYFDDDQVFDYFDRVRKYWHELGRHYQRHVTARAAAYLKWRSEVPEDTRFI